MAVKSGLLTETALGMIVSERDRQRELVAAGSLKWIASDSECPNDLKLAALFEEAGEVARAYHDGWGAPNEVLRTELVHTAAVAVAWIESLLSP